MRIIFIPLLLVFAVFFACTSTGPTCAEGDESCNNNGGSSSDDNGESSSSSGGGGNSNGSMDPGSHAVMPSNKDESKLRDMYNTWINLYYTTYEADDAVYGFNPDLMPEGVSGTARIKASFNGVTDGSRTASEAIGYGMILTALMADWEKFNKLLAYSKAWRYKIDGNQTALMRWNIRNFMNSEGGSATDADIDILASLIIAYQKSKEQRYLNEALEIGRSIFDYEVDASTRLILPATKGERMGNGSLFNISYISLPAIKMMEIYDKDRNWADVLDKNLSYMEMVQNKGDGLWPDWSDASGNPTDPKNNSSDCLPSSSTCTIRSHEAYYKEAPRIPWRIAWYYHWYGDERAKSMLDKGMAFLKSKGVSTSQDVKNFYSYTGGITGTTNGGVRDWASMCALGMGSSANQDWLNSCNDRILGYFNPSLNSYYGSSLQVIYSMLFNGKF